MYNTHAIETLLTMFWAFIRFDVQFFTQPEPSLQWLAGSSLALPPMLAKWQQQYGPPPATSDSVAEPQLICVSLV